MKEKQKQREAERKKMRDDMKKNAMMAQMNQNAKANNISVEIVGL